MKTTHTLTDAEKADFEQSYYDLVMFDDREIEGWTPAGRPWLLPKTKKSNWEFEKLSDLVKWHVRETESKTICKMMENGHESAVYYEKRVMDYAKDLFESGICDTFADAIDFYEENHRGDFDSWEDFSQDYLEETGDWRLIPEHLRKHFDMEAFVDDMKQDFIECNGSYYWNHS